MTNPDKKRRSRPVSEPRGRAAKPATHQPTKAELEADVSIPTTPDELLRAVIDYSPPKALQVKEKLGH